MKRIIHRELLKIFSNIETAEDDAKDTALSEFADELHDYCRREKDLAERTRTLRFARSELATAQGRIIHTGAGKKCGNSTYYCTSLYSDLATCGVMDGKRKENLKTEITNLINEL